MTRAESIKEKLSEQRSRGEIIDKIHIIANGTGFDYHSIFGKYLDDKVKEVCLEEPYLRDYYQVREWNVTFWIRNKFNCLFSTLCSAAANQFRAILWIDRVKMPESKIRLGDNGEGSAQWS